MTKTIVFAVLFLGFVAPVLAQTSPAIPPNSAPSVNAGTLLEQQRRQDPVLAPEAPEPGVLPSVQAVPPPATDSTTRITALRFVVEGATRLDPEEVQAALAPWLNRPVTLADLRAAGRAVEALYQQRGWLAQVRLPSQDITNGTVRLAVSEAVLDRIVLQPGDKPMSADLLAQVRALLEHHLVPGQPLSTDKLERALLLADDTPGVRVSGSLQAGQSPDSTDVVVAVNPSAPYMADLSLSNSGSRATGIRLANAQLRLLSPLGKGELVSLGASLSEGSQYLSLAGQMPLGPRGWRVSASTSALRYQVLDARNTTTGLAPEGDSSTWGINTSYPLIRSAISNLALSAGLVQTRLSNRDDNLTVGQLDTTSAARSRVLQLGLLGNHFDRLGGGGANSASLVLSAGHLSLDGSPANVITADAQTVGSQGRFNKLRYSASRMQNITPRLSLLVSATGQLADANLDPSEKLYLGGANGVRAYPNAEGGGSAGTQLSLELRQQIDNRWLVTGFYDWGQVQQYKHNYQAANPAAVLLDKNTISLKGAGVALAWRGPGGVQVQGTWARRIGKNPLATSTGTDTDGSLQMNRLWLNASIAF